MANHGPETELSTPNYKILAADLRETDRVEEKLKKLGVSKESPTFILTECVLVYLKPDESVKILNFLRDFFTGDLALLNYEMINPNDKFGKVMLENLEVIKLKINLFRIVDAVYKGFMNAQMKPLKLKD